MCWVAADRLAKHRRPDSATENESHTGVRAPTSCASGFLREAYDTESGAIMETWGGTRLDASTLVLAELGFICGRRSDAFSAPWMPSRSTSSAATTSSATSTPTTSATPHTSFNLCTFWYIDALARVGRTDEARELVRAHARAVATTSGCCQKTCTRHRRIVGQLPADVLDGRHHHDRGAAVQPWESRLVSRLIVVSNRVALPRETRAGGLAAAMHSALSENGGIWFGWSGKAVETPGRPTSKHEGAIKYVTVDLGRSEYDAYYNGFANRTLWPLLHYRLDLVDYRRDTYRVYQRVNRSFRATARPDDQR